jgi:DNA-binding GntR family transcriptional regulator
MHVYVYTTYRSRSKKIDPFQRLNKIFEAQTGSTASRVRQALATGVEDGWLPPGTRLGEVRLASAFTVSRTPVREALFRLEAEGLIDRDARGHVVSRLSSHQIIELYEVREALDGAAARSAALRAPRLEFERLKTLNHSMRSAANEERFDDMADINVEFHGILAIAAGNTMLLDLVAQVHSHVKRFQKTTLAFPGRAAEVIKEHGELIDALMSGDADRAESVARSHIQAARDVRITIEAEVFTE